MEELILTLCILLWIVAAAFAIKWGSEITSVKKALNNINDSSSIKQLAHSLLNNADFTEHLKSIGLNRNNLIIEVISAISKCDGEEVDGTLIQEMFKAKFNRYVFPTIITAIISVMVSFFIPDYSVLLISAILLICVLIIKSNADQIEAKTYISIVDCYIPYFCTKRSKHNEDALSTMKQIEDKLDTEISYLQQCSENTDNSQKFAGVTNENLQHIIDTLRDMYKFSLEESKKTPFEACERLNESIGSFNKATSAAVENFDKNMNLYNQCLARIGDIGKVEKSVAVMRKQTVDSMAEISASYSNVANSVKAVMEEQLSEFVGDSKFTFSNLNIMTAEIYEKIKEIFSTHVETSNKMCTITENGLKEITTKVDMMHKRLENSLDTSDASSERIEKAVIALCAANYKLVEVLEHSDPTESNAALKSALNSSKYDLTEYFKSVVENIDELSEKLEKISENIKGDE